MVRVLTGDCRELLASATPPGEAARSLSDARTEPHDSAPNRTGHITNPVTRIEHQRALHAPRTCTACRAKFSPRAPNQLRCPRCCAGDRYNLRGNKRARGTLR